jgi:hypothetical protein
MKSKLISTLMVTTFGCAMSTYGNASHAPAQFCSPIRWLHTPDQARAGLAVQAALNGKVVYFQLDTGAARSVLYRRLVNDAGIDIPWQGDGALAGLAFEGAERRSIDFSVDDDLTDNGHADNEDADSLPVVGSIGLDALVGRTTILDFRRSRFCIIEAHHALPFEHVEWVDARLQFGRIFVTVKAGNREYPGFFYDSGSNSFSAVVEKDMWKVLTGKRPVDASDHKSVDSWGSKLAFYGAPSVQPLHLGALSLGMPTIFSADLDLFDRRRGEQGVIGNRVFENGTLILNLGPTPRLGYIEGR